MPSGGLWRGRLLGMAKKLDFWSFTDQNLELQKDNKISILP